MNRRKFLRNTSFVLPTAIAGGNLLKGTNTKSFTGDVPLLSESWLSVRDQFILDHHHIQMAQMLLASHPTRVRNAIAEHRKAFDTNPAAYWEEHFQEAEKKVCEAAGKYMNVNPEEIALTDSTTQGLAMIYNGFKLKPGDEVVATTHDHYVTDKSLDYACAKKGATIKRIAEYADPSQITVEEVTENFRKAITEKTRLVVCTWVQSCTGVKLPIKAISEVVAEANRSRSFNDRIYFSVDGVHGFGNQDVDISELGCDIFVAGTHKWIFGPRGTGLAWAKKTVWHMIEPTVPSFRMNPYLDWMGFPIEGEMTFGDLITPGGFHAFDHRWALGEAFNFHMELGRDRVHQRTTELNTMLKEGIEEMGHIKLHTPLDPALSAGINCIEIDGMDAMETVAAFHEKGIISSSSPYRISYARLTPCIINTEDEVLKCLEVMEGMGV